MVERAIMITVLMITICATANIVQGEPKTNETNLEAEAAFDQALTPLQSRSDCEDRENAVCIYKPCCEPMECIGARIQYCKRTKSKQ